MLIRNIEDTPRTAVEMEGVKDTSMALMVGRDDKAPNFAVRHFQVEPGGHTPHHSHDFEHEVYVVSGTGEVLLDGAFRPIRKGDVLFVPAEETHQFRATGKEPLQFLCMVPMSRDCGDPVPMS